MIYEPVWSEPITPAGALYGILEPVLWPENALCGTGHSVTY